MTTGRCPTGERRVAGITHRGFTFVQLDYLIPGSHKDNQNDLILPSSPQPMRRRLLGAGPANGENSWQDTGLLGRQDPSVSYLHESRIWRTKPCSI